MHVSLNLFITWICTDRDLAILMMMEIGGGGNKDRKKMYKFQKIHFQSRSKEEIDHMK